MNVDESGLSVEGKKKILELSSTLDAKDIEKSSEFAKKVKGISSEVEKLSVLTRTSIDLSFFVNILDYTTDRLTTHLECNDPAREVFSDCIADGVTMSSWCPNGYPRLEELTKLFAPARVSFQKTVSVKDLEASRGERPETPIKQKRAQSQRLIKGPVMAPKQITMPDEVVQSLKIHMKETLSVLKEVSDESPIPYLKFVINPRSFVQTTYNVFLVSFLVHERRAIFSVGDNYEPLIQRAPPSEQPDDSFDGTYQNMQVVMSISPSEWSQLVSKLKLKSSMLPEFCPQHSQYFPDSQLGEELGANVLFLPP